MLDDTKHDKNEVKRNFISHLILKTEEDSDGVNFLQFVQETLRNFPLLATPELHVPFLAGKKIAQKKYVNVKPYHLRKRAMFVHIGAYHSGRTKFDGRSGGGGRGFGNTGELA